MKFFFGPILISFFLSAYAGEDLIQIDIERHSGMEFVPVDSHCYTMGQNTQLPPEDGSYWGAMGYSVTMATDEEPEHEVCLDSFWMGRYEVTARQWGQIMGKKIAKSAENYPIAGISWNEARIFASKVTELDGKYRYRLPTEAEWEGACLAGIAPVGIKEKPRYMSENYGWSMGNRYEQKSSEVGKLKSNKWGIYDMIGNVWEWTEDSYQTDAYRLHAVNSPKVLKGGEQKVIRGGSFRLPAQQISCTLRGHQPPSEVMPNIGFRLVRE